MTHKCSDCKHSHHSIIWIECKHKDSEYQVVGSHVSKIHYHTITHMRLNRCGTDATLFSKRES